MFGDPNRITPEEFELQVKAWLEASSGTLDSFEAKHREIVAGVDGEYEIDVTMRFTLLGGMKIFGIVECKKHKNPIKREIVQALHARKESLGAHKAIIVSTAPFQEGARKFADVHGIALIELLSGEMAYIQGTAGPPRGYPPNAEPYMGWMHEPSHDGRDISIMVKKSFPYGLERFLAEDLAG